MKIIAIIVSVVLLFIIHPIYYALIINLVLFSILSILELRKEKRSVDAFVFFTVNLIMLILNFIAPKFTLLPRTPHFIYTIYSVFLLVGLFKNDYLFSKERLEAKLAEINKIKFIKSSIWLLSFMGASGICFYFFPNSKYLILSSVLIVTAAITNIVFSINLRKKINALSDNK